MDKNGNFVGNAGACLPLDGTLSNTLAMKLAYQEKTTLSCKFRPRDDLFSALLNSSKKKRYLICCQGDHSKARLYLNKQIIPPMEKGFV